MKRVFKLKDFPPTRRYAQIDLKKEFGFIPHEIAIVKVQGSHDKFGVLAILTPAEEKKEDANLKGKKVKAS